MKRIRSDSNSDIPEPWASHRVRANDAFMRLIKEMIRNTPEHRKALEEALDKRVKELEIKFREEFNKCAKLKAEVEQEIMREYKEERRKEAEDKMVKNMNLQPAVPVSMPRKQTHILDILK